MAMECAHCGARTEDDSARRCPRCLRATGLPPLGGGGGGGNRAGRPWVILAAVGLLVLASAGGTVWYVTHRARPGANPLADLRRARGLAPEDLPPLWDVGASSAPAVAAARSGGTGASRASAVARWIGERLRGAAMHVATRAEDVPPSRSIDGIARALGTNGARVTLLDMARLIVAAVRTSGGRADVAERTRAARPGDPADPSGLVGSYIVVAESSAIELDDGTVIPARDAGARALDDAAVGAAMLAQSAIAAAAAGTHRDRALAMADAAVQAWPQGVVPLAARAFVARAVGGSSGTAMAEQDLAAALALRDDASLHIVRIRLALTASSGDPRVIESDARSAARGAPTWGTAALAAAILLHEADAGDPCAPLATAHDPWTADALEVCRSTDGTPGDSTRAAAQRLLQSAGDDAMRIALAATGGAEGFVARVRSQDRRELVAWLLLLGRPDLARAVAGPRDAGH